MTVSIAWTRKVRNYEELVFVSDSRLTGGKKFDACPKILALPRTDCAIAFANTSGDGFSMMIQLALAIEAYPPALRRQLELNQLVEHALSVFNGMLENIHPDELMGNPGLEKTDAEFLFGGYSWKEKRFRLWSIHYSLADQRFRASLAKTLIADKLQKKLVSKERPSRRYVRLGEVAFAGNQARAARILLYKVLSAKLAADVPLNRINMEPFEVVRDMLRYPSLQPVGYKGSIGGSPQILKVFQYSRTASFAVYWPDRNGLPHYHGRPCLPYEHLDKLCIDPDTFQTFFLSSDEAIAGTRAKVEQDDLADDPFGGARLILDFLKARIKPFTKLVS